jgi:uncharacterized protein YcbK (DUF882 family)/LysM repeat protein
MRSIRQLLVAAVLVLGPWCVEAATAPGVASAQRHHTVRPGQSLSRIARRYRVEVWDLAMANRMRPSDTLRPGQTLTVPPRGVTYVRPGQTLSHVAREHDCTVDALVRLNRLRRRRGLRVGQRLVLPGYQPAEAAVDRDWGEPDEPGVVTIHRRGERTTLRLVDAEGRVTREALEGLARLMRRHEDDEPELPHPRLARLLASISDHFGGRALVLVSGRREAGGYTRETSRHTSGHATDIRVRGVPRRAIWDYCRSLSHTGCGYYPRSTFVHVDVRGRAAQWVDWSRPGQRPRYGNLRGPWRRFCRNRRHRRHRRCRRETRRVTRAEAVPLEVELTAAAREIMPVIPEVGEPGEGDPEEVLEELDDELDEEELESAGAAEDAEAEASLES